LKRDAAARKKPLPSGDEAPPVAVAAKAPAPAAKAGEIDFQRIARLDAFDYVSVERRSQIAEEYRILRTRLQIVKPRRNSVILTSCRHGEGKTSTAANLALVMAQRRNQRILLIDLDLRRPQIGKYFNILPPHDFVDVIRGRASIEDALVYSERENLHVMVARRQYSNATELLEASTRHPIFDTLHAHFDYLVIDTCPCLSTADPMVVGPVCGGALMVVRMRQTQRESIAHAVNILKEQNVPTLGFVLTFMTYIIPQYFSRYQYYHDAHYYYERYQSQEETGEG
ncbi:MAG: CpsD/CapB family tyrosine-protein kinase, partial [Planctomycetota bacterium]